MIKVINRNNPPVKTIAIFIHGFIGSEETWVNKKNKTLVDSLIADNSIKENFDLGLFLYQTKLLEFFPKLSRLEKTVFRKKKAVKTLPIEGIGKILSLRFLLKGDETQRVREHLFFK